MRARFDSGAVDRWCVARGSFGGDQVAEVGIGLKSGRADEFGEAAHADVVGSAPGSIVSLLVDRWQVVDGDGVMRLSVALGRFCGLVVDFGDAGELADEIAGLGKGVAVGQGSAGRCLADFGEVDGCRLGVSSVRKTWSPASRTSTRRRLPSAAAARSPDASEGCQVNTPRMGARSAAVSGCSRLACAASGALGGPVQRDTEIPGATPECSACQHFGVVVVTTTICLLSARSIPTIAFPPGTNSRSRASRALRFRSPRETPLPLPKNVLLMRWDTKPDSASGGRSHATHRHAERLSMPRRRSRRSC
jgi:hypothetical protein